MFSSSEFTLFFAATVVCIFGWILPVHAQSISGIVTTSDQQQLLSPISDSFSFSSDSSSSADITIDPSTVYQQIVGFGSSITDSAAAAMSDLKAANPSMYQQYLQNAFTPQGAALNYLRVPIGSSDFSNTTYSLDDTSGDTSFNSFEIDNAPSYLFSTLADIAAVNSNAKIHILPWSPPAWMKDGNTMNGGSLSSQYVSAYPTYLLKAVQAFKAKGLLVAAVSIQNEPENSNPTYPSCSMTADVQATIAKSLANLSDIKVIGYEHNWQDADAPSAFSGVSFHCYAGSQSDVGAFASQFPNVPMYQTECAGTTGSNFWTDVQWYGMMWIFASPDNGVSPYPGSNSCGNGCRGVTTVTPSGVTYNQEYYSMAHFARAFTSDDGTSIGSRIAANTTSSGSDLTAVAYAVGSKYSLVVMNTGSSASYTFPTGLTTLWWNSTSTDNTSSSSSSSKKRMMRRRKFNI
ncbi:glycoside hydrolase [Gymnopus androsaceus JB14]|uniref:Glycoside hydrolase n=1 Tax=Gymnopus androsaceus JB14 TaxID=1447944 RepID=A0A6A4HH18_9AGAR|nr:glycoside hydrolase [Gymnopus androsaceus JB14]